jgi:hexosaminidase
VVLASATTAALAQTHDLLPVPREASWGAGSLVLGESDGRGPARFALEGRCDLRVERALDRASARLVRRGAPRPIRVARGKAAAMLVVACAHPGRPVQAVDEDESYSLTVDSRGAKIEAPNSLGALRGLETFLQLARREGTRWVVPAVTIRDAPRFPWRGLLVDPCRHWIPVDVVKRTLDGMAAVKMNVLHWHLTEDQGFRIESRRFPRLHEQGSDGLYYTQEQVREVIAYARDLGIRVVPEFDMPGHTTSWLVGHPELAAGPGPFAIVRTWGIFDAVFDPTREEVYAFLDGFLGEMAALFPDAYLHIGGDEVTGKPWNEDPRILDFIYQRGMRDKHDLQVYFNTRVNEILTRHGKRMMGWDEILQPGLPKTVVVQSWRGAQALADGARQGYDVILSQGYYLDHMLSAATHYAADPIPADSPLTEAERRHVLGGEACMWAEFVSPETVDSRVWPRTAAIAERLWSRADLRDADDLYRRLEVQGARLEELGLTHRSAGLAILRRLAGSHPVEPLKVLADVVEPLKHYQRGQTRRYTSETPLDRLVDAAAPESDVARRFGREVERFLATPAASRDDRGLRELLGLWRDNHRALDAVAAAVPALAEVRTLSRDLSSVGELGLAALDRLRSAATTAEWQAQARLLLDQAKVSRAAVTLAILPSVARLVDAAAAPGR